MAWRNQGITGSNNIPLGKRRFGPDGEEDGFKHGSASPNGFANGPSNGSSNGDRDVKRGRSPERTLSIWLYSQP
jgi:splicing factor 1